MVDRVVNHVLIIIAMEAEAKPLLDHLSLQPVESNVPFAVHKIYSGKYKDYRVSLVTSGHDKKYGVDSVGTTPAAIATFSSVAQLNPDLIINAGTAGGYAAKTANIGDVFIGTDIRHHDRRIPIPGFDEYGRGNHFGLQVPHLVQTLGFKTGGVTTGNSLDHSPTDDEIIKQFDASVKDMEAAAVAWVADLSNTKLLVVKVVTDIVDSDRPTQEQFFENLATAAKSLQEAVPKIVDFVIGKKISDL